MIQQAKTSTSEQQSLSKSRRFHRTAQRSESSLSYRSSKSKGIHQKTKVTYIRKNTQNAQTPDNSDLVSQDSQAGLFGFSGILTAQSRDQSNARQKTNQAKNLFNTPTRNSANRNKRHDDQFYSQKKELQMYQDILSKQRRMRQSAQLENKELLRKLTQLQKQYYNLQWQSKQNQKQLRRLRFQINNLEADRQQNATLWKTIDMLEIDKIQKEQQIRQLLLFRQTDQKTVLRLTEEITNYRKRKNHKLPPFPMAEHECYSAIPNASLKLNQSSPQIYQAIVKQMQQKDRQIQKLNDELTLLNSRMQNQCQRLAQQKKKITYQYEKKIADLSSNYRILQRQQNLLNNTESKGLSKNDKSRKISQDLEYDLSPDNQN